MDGRTEIQAREFFHMLDATLPRPDVAPLDLWQRSPRLHFLIFVHRVRDLEQGLYVFERGTATDSVLRASLGSAATWDRVPGCPEHLRLHRVATGDFRDAARAVSCGQDIAADGAFSLGMAGEFRTALEEGAHEYRRLFWEAGLLGQILYLEAEAHGVRATGIGCYFDDEMHRLFGIEGEELQSLYHFTVGGAVEDPRLQTLPPYADRDRVPDQ
jgi:hypothetical protein